VTAAPDYAEALLDWRSWRIVRRGDGLALTSAVQRTVWPAQRTLTAECLRSPSLIARVRRRPHHQAPDLHCQCGIYGATLTQAGSYLGDTPGMELGRVLGLVALWGLVIECERGYRASSAYPSRLYVPADAVRELDAQAIASGLACYQVPVEPIAADWRHAVQALAELAPAA
jgi:hypothetical protein